MSVHSSAGSPVYARFTRRVQAVYVDLIILALIATAALIVAISFNSDDATLPLRAGQGSAP